MSHRPRDLINQIFSLDPAIRYVAILDQRGRHLEGGMRPRTESLNPIEEEDKLFIQTTISRGMSESWTKYFDRFRYCIIAHQKLKVLQFPMMENILLITAEPDISLDVVENITDILDKAL
jgi:hypothetical protein